MSAGRGRTEARAAWRAHEPGPSAPARRTFKTRARGISNGTARAHLDDEHDWAAFARRIGEARAEQGGQAAGRGLVSGWDSVGI